VQLFGEAGPAAGETVVTVPAGRTVKVEMTGTSTSEPLSASLIAEGGSIVVGTTSSTPDGNGFGATSGVPWVQENGAG
jgi:hypothetical protein